MPALNFGLSDDLETTRRSTHDNYASSNCVHPNYANSAAADGTHHDKLKMGPAILLAAALSLICWGGIIGGIYLIIH